MKRVVVITAALVAVAFSGSLTCAQQGPGYSAQQVLPRHDQTVPSQVPQRAAGRVKPTAPSREEILRDAGALVQSIGLSCQVADASLFNEGTANINGHDVHVRTFETACSNGLGYFLIEQPPEKTAGFSCFGADATRQSDISQGRAPGPACTLPANADIKAMAGRVLAGLGNQCQATASRSIGRDTAANAELTEVACTGGIGFVIASPLPGSAAPLNALSCPDAYRRGIACKLSSNGAPIITMQTFADALVQHRVPCTIQGSRLLGKESVNRRHLVEFKCPEQPGGLVAAIPLEDNAKPFETMDCATAGTRYHAICMLNQIH